MDKDDFYKEKKVLGKKYSTIFGKNPEMKNYDCTKEEFIMALKKSIVTKKDISNFLKEKEPEIEKE